MIQDIYKKCSHKVRLTILVLLLLGSGLVFTQTSSNYLLKNQITDQGGALSQSTHYKINDAIGQSTPVGVAASSNYRISGGTFGGGLIINDVSEQNNVTVPDRFALSQNYPNPFNPQTTIAYQLAVTSDVLLAVYDLQGQLVRNLVNGTKATGCYKVSWDGHNDSGQKMASGLYFLWIRAVPHAADRYSFSACRKMVLLK